eukprot:7129803-Prymnesium_polylepis.1
MWAENAKPADDTLDWSQETQVSVRRRTSVLGDLRPVRVPCPLSPDAAVGAGGNETVHVLEQRALRH